MKKKPRITAVASDR